MIENYIHFVFVIILNHVGFILIILKYKREMISEK
jgi:hypothetical protein